MAKELNEMPVSYLFRVTVRITGAEDKKTDAVLLKEKRTYRSIKAEDFKHDPKFDCPQMIIDRKKVHEI